MIMTITPNGKSFGRSSFKMFSRACFSKNLLAVNLLFQYEKLKYSQVSEACRKHYVLIFSNSGIKQILTKYYAWLPVRKCLSKTINKVGINFSKLCREKLLD